LRRWATAEPAVVAADGLGAEARRRLGNIRKLEADLEIHTAVATVRPRLRMLRTCSNPC
jgi:2-polyprenyl-6-methoxyphenol hydroxylase-like FAD-dependent oxidoreductase